MKEEQKEIEKELGLRRNEFLAYIKDVSVKSNLDNLNPKREMKEVKVPSGEKFLGIDISKTVKKPTGYLLITEKDFKNIQNLNTHTKKREAKLLNLLETDLYKENKELKNELAEQKNKNIQDIDDYNKLIREYNDLNKENTSLKSQISDLKLEIKLIYNSTKEFLKDRTSDMTAFKDMFKELVNSIAINLKNNSLTSNFKKEYDKENRVKKREGPRL